MVQIRISNYLTLSRLKETLKKKWANRVKVLRMEMKVRKGKMGNKEMKELLVKMGIVVKKKTKLVVKRDKETKGKMETKRLMVKEKVVRV